MGNQFKFIIEVSLMFCIGLVACSQDKSEFKEAAEAEKDATQLSESFLSTVKNGGDVVRCDQTYPNLGNNMLSVLDLYEARKSGLIPNLGDSSLSVDEKVQLVLARLEHLDPTRFATYSEYFRTFFDEIQIAPNLDIPELPDQEVVELPGSDCAIKQLALQRTPELPSDKRYIIKKEIWDLLDNDNKAALIIHELIYREAREYGQENSRKVRYYNGRLLSDDFRALDGAEYSLLLKDVVGLPAIYVLDVFGERYGLSLATVQFYPSGRFKRGDLEHLGGTLAYVPQGPNVILIYDFHGSMGMSEDGTRLGVYAFDRYGSVAYSRFGDTPFLAPELHSGCFLYDEVNVRDIHLVNGALESFTVDGALMPACAVKSLATQTPFSVKQEVKFHPNGVVSEAVLAQDFIFTFPDGTPSVHAAGDVVTFDSTGRLQR